MREMKMKFISRDSGVMMELLIEMYRRLDEWSDWVLGRTSDAAKWSVVTTSTFPTWTNIFGVGLGLD
jgi:hypothetical protein